MSTNGLTKYEGTEPPEPLPGWSAGTRVLRGTITMVSGAAMEAPLVVAAVGHHDVWVFGSLAVGLVAAIVGTVISTLGFQKGRAEQRVGYATLPKIASINPALFLLDRRDFHVLLYPNQPRPRTRNGKDMDAWRAQWDYPDQAGR
jgi:hypothetical protein